MSVKLLFLVTKNWKEEEMKVKIMSLTKKNCKLEDIWKLSQYQVSRVTYLDFWLSCTLLPAQATRKWHWSPRLILRAPAGSTWPALISRTTSLNELKGGLHPSDVKDRPRYCLRLNVYLPLYMYVSNLAQPSRQLNRSTLAVDCKQQKRFTVDFYTDYTFSYFPRLSPWACLCWKVGHTVVWRFKSIISKLYFLGNFSILKQAVNSTFKIAIYIINDVRIEWIIVRFL